MKKILIFIFLILILTTISFSQNKVTAEAAKKLASNDISGAIAILTDAIEHKKDLFEAYKMRANLYSMQGNINGAMADLESAIQIKPKTGNLYIELARFKMMTQDLQGSMKVYDLAIANGAEGDKVFSERGFLKRITGDFDGALADYKLAVNIRPHSSVANVGVADMMEEKGDLDGALAYLQTFVNKIENDWENQFPSYKFKNVGSNQNIIENQPKDGSQIRTTGQQVVITKSNPNSNMSAQNQTAEIEQVLNFGMAYERLAGFYEKKGNLEKALIYANKGISLNPRDLGSFQIRGKILFDKGDYDGAIEDFNTVIRSSPPFAKIFLDRGLAYFMKGKDAEAQKDFDKYLQMYPKDKETLDQRIEEAKKIRESKK